MLKKVGKIGSSIGIIFSKKECEIYGIKLNEIVDLSDMQVLKKKNSYSVNWRKKNPTKSKKIKDRYEVKRKAKRKKIREEKENNKYF